MTDPSGTAPAFKRAPLVLSKLREFPIVSVDTETTGLSWLTDRIFGISVAAYDPIARVMMSGYYDIREKPQIVGALQKELPLCRRLVNHHIKFDAHFLLNEGIVLPDHLIECTMVRAALIDEHELSFDLDTLGTKHVGAGKMTGIYQQLADMFGGAPTKNVQMKNLYRAPSSMVAKYAIPDAEVAALLWAWQEEEIERQNLHQVWALEKALTPTVIRMERHGVRVDAERAERSIKDLTVVVNRERRELDKMAGFEINPNPSGSIKQLFAPKMDDNGRWVLVDGTIAGATDGGQPSIDADCLRRMKHPAAAKILRVRQLMKCRDTFLKGHILGHQHNGRVHCNINQTKGDNDAGTGCMTADTLILTDGGWVPVVDVKPGALVVDHTGVPQRVVDWFDNGVHPIYKVTTKLGHSIKVTGNHPFYSNDKFIRADQLVVGDNLLVYGQPEVCTVIDNIEGRFQVTSWGRVLNKNGIQRKQQKKARWGHLKITVGNVKTKRLDRTTHRLVAESFDIPGDRSANIVMHKNGIVWDNSVQNLAWGSCRDNNITGAAHGSYWHQSKLTEADVQFIRITKYLSDGQMARALSISREMVRDIRNNKKWNRDAVVVKRLEFSIDAVSSVTLEPPAHTYGIEVANTHTHLTAGIVTHNTGRLSINSPALQQIPSRDKEVKAIVRPCFLPDEGQKWLGIDWSSFEYRVFAHYLNDPVITQRYADDPDTDFHQVVSDLTGIPRNAQYVGGPSSKAINLSMVFGAGPGKAAEMMGLPFTINVGRGGKEYKNPGPEAQEIFDKYHAAVPGVKSLLEKAANIARSRGYVLTIAGRHTRFPGGRATHKAGGLVFQGTSADCMKIKLNEIDAICTKHGNSALLLTVHDEVGVSIPDDDDNELTKRIVKAYTTFDGIECPVKFRVPITCSWGVGDDWLEAKG